MEDTLRLFFALPLPGGLRRVLGGWQGGQAGPAGWSRPEGLHLTLAFLGARPLQGIPILEGLGAAVAHRHAPVPLRTAGLGGFPEGAPARVLWLGIAPSPPLEALAADLRGALAEGGHPFDAKPFRPHITLARFRRARPLEAFPAPPDARFVAADLVLFESRPGGEYAPLRAWALGHDTAGV